MRLGQSQGGMEGGESWAWHGTGTWHSERRHWHGDTGHWRAPVTESHLCAPGLAGVWWHHRTSLSCSGAALGQSLPRGLLVGGGQGRERLEPATHPVQISPRAPSQPLCQGCALCPQQQGLGQPLGPGLEVPSLLCLCSGAAAAPLGQGQGQGGWSLSWKMVFAVAWQDVLMGKEFSSKKLCSNPVGFQDIPVLITNANQL